MAVGVRLEEGISIEVGQVKGSTNAAFKQNALTGKQETDVNTCVGETAGAPATVSVTDVATVIFGSDTTRVMAVFRNTHATEPLFAGYSSAITVANAPLKLLPGEVWVEDRTRTAIYGIANTGITVVTAKQSVLS